MTLLLIVARITGFMVTAPFFSRREIPALAKIALVWALALLILPGVPVWDFGVEGFIFYLLCESLYGLALGWSASFLFISFQGAGHLIEQQAGFGMGAWFDPALGQTGIISKFMALLGVMMFLALNGHHILILTAMTSFAMVPLGLGFPQAGVIEVLFHTFLTSFIFILRFAAPVIVVIFVTDILLGLLGKTVPQLNVLMEGLPIKGMVSLLVLLSMLPAYINLTEPILQEMTTVLSRILEKS